MKTKTITYDIRCKETGDYIDSYSSLENAELALEAYEDGDKSDGTYTPDFYEIAKVKTITKTKIIA